MKRTYAKYILTIFCVLSIAMTSHLSASPAEIQVLGVAEIKVEPNQFPLIFEIKNSQHSQKKLAKRQASEVSEIIKKIERELNTVELETLYYTLREKPKSETLPAYEVDYDAITSIQAIAQTHKDYEILLSILAGKKVDRIQTSAFYFKDKTDTLLMLEKKALENAIVKATALLTAFPNASLGNPLKIDIQNSGMNYQRMNTSAVSTVENTHTLMKPVPIKARVHVAFEIIYTN